MPVEKRLKTLVGPDIGQTTCGNNSSFFNQAWDLTESRIAQPRIQG